MFNYKKIFSSSLNNYLSKVVNNHKDKYANLPLKSQINVNYNKEKSKDNYIENILFNELLISNDKFVLYDCDKNLIKHYYYKNLFLNSINFYVCWVNDNLNIFVLSFIYIFMAYNINVLYRVVQKSYVEKIIYDSFDKTFEITMKHFYYPFSYKEKINYDEIIYTNDEDLNSIKVNFINTKNLKTYFIGYEMGWVDKKFFSYLIKQNISGKMI